MVCTRTSSAWCGFNGAASMRMRRGSIGKWILGGWSSLQWGRIHADAEGLLHFPLPDPRSTMLQWGRIHADAEGPRGCAQNVHDGSASMGPHPCGCGGTVTALQTPGLSCASMGPHPCGCGGVTAFFGISWFRDLLQWGRIHADAEGRV